MFRFRQLRRSVAVIAALVTVLVAFWAPTGAAEAASRPRVVSLSATSGSTSGGNRITVSGTGFTKVKKVLFGSIAGTGVKVASSKRLSVVVPAAGAGTVSVRVVTKKGTSKVAASATDTYVAPTPPTPAPPTPAPPTPTPPAAPTLTTISPNSGGLGGGTTVTINGANLTAVTSVTFAGAAGTGLTMVSATQLRVSTPARTATGAVDVTVTTSHGSATAAKGFTYVASGTLTAGQTLTAGTQLNSPNAGYHLSMQTDGNLVLYTAAGVAKWSTGTTTGAGNTATMQSDGNLVVYSAAGKALWNSNTAGFGGASVTMQDDGNLVMYRNGRAIWSKDNPLYDRLPSGWTLTANQSLVSQNRQYTLIMQGDGNLVVYKSGVAQWASSTSGSGNWAVMQGDGNLVVYTSANKALWASNTAGKSGAWLIMQDDGNLVMYLSGTAVWASKGTSTGAGPIASIALANVGKGACSTNSAGGVGYYNSCNEPWCADFVKWVWSQAGYSVSGITAAAGSFYTGRSGSKLHTDSSYAPQVGDAVVFNYKGNGVADHVGMIVAVHSDGSVDVIHGNVNNVVTLIKNVPASQARVGAAMTTSGLKVGNNATPVVSAFATP